MSAAHACRNDGQLVPPTDMGSAQQLLQEAQYYQLPGLVRQMQEHVMALETARVSCCCCIYVSLLEHSTEK